MVAFVDKIEYRGLHYNQWLILRAGWKSPSAVSQCYWGARERSSFWRVSRTGERPVPTV